MKKFILGIIIFIGGVVSFCNAETIQFPSAFNTNTSNQNFSSNNYNTKITETSKGNGKYFCYSNVYTVNSSSYLSRIGEASIYFCDDTLPNNATDLSTLSYCHLIKSGITGTIDGHLYQNTGYNCSFMDFSNVNNKIYVLLNRKTVGNSVSFTYSFSVNNLLVLANSTDFLNSFNLINKDNVNTNYCVNNNLCPICPTIDQNYCESNNLCPVCNNNSGNINTGVNWSALFLNGQQITSNAIIDIYAENYLKTDVEYLNDTVDIDISFEEDTDYINNVINQEKLTPTKEDFETLLIGLAEFIPYLFIALLFIVIVKITRKIWK